MTPERRARGSRRWLVIAPIVAGALAVPGVGAPSLAASLTLTQAETQAALGVGARSVTKESFGSEWRVDNRAGDSVVVVTPFHRIALAARHAAFKNEEVKPADVTRLLREQRDRLVFWATLKGAREDFARYLEPELVVGDQVVKASFVQNERTPAPREGGGYLARCVWSFPTKDLTGTSKVSLVARDADRREAHAFTVDLGQMR
jgi:hypothetical protein